MLQEKISGGGYEFRRNAVGIYRPPTGGRDNTFGVEEMNLNPLVEHVRKNESQVAAELLRKIQKQGRSGFRMSQAEAWRNTHVQALLRAKLIVCCETDMRDWIRLQLNIPKIQEVLSSLQ